MADVSFNPASLAIPVPEWKRPDRADYVRRWHRDARRSRRQDYLADKSCMDCGARSFLEIDHIDPNQKVDHRHIWHWCRERREQELAKCVVRCDVCHDRRHSETLWMLRGWTGWRGQGRI